MALAVLPTPGLERNGRSRTLRTTHVNKQDERKQPLSSFHPMRNARNTSAHCCCTLDTTLSVVLMVVVVMVVVVAEMMVVMSTLVAATSRTAVAIDVGNGSGGSTRGTKSIQILTAGGPWLSIGEVTWPQLELISLRFAHGRTDHYDQHDEHG
uniref:Uncharacterized protein n=1 Tax=Anopheles dirus TaxID=7168 RepID=A0A182N5F4_9DIPT